MTLIDITGEWTVERREQTRVPRTKPCQPVLKLVSFLVILLSFLPSIIFVNVCWDMSVLILVVITIKHNCES